MLKHLSLSCCRQYGQVFCFDWWHRAIYQQVFSQSGQWDGTPAANTRTPFAVVYPSSVHFTHSDDPPLHLKEVNHKMWCKSLSLWLACYHQDATSRLCCYHTHTHTHTHHNTRTHAHTHASGLPIIFMLLSQTANINRLSNCNENMLHPASVCLRERQALLSVRVDLNATHSRPPSARPHPAGKSNTFKFISLTSLANCFILF